MTAMRLLKPSGLGSAAMTAKKTSPANLEPYSPSGLIMSVGMSTSASHALALQPQYRVTP